MLIKFVFYLWKLNLKVTPVNYGRYSVHHKLQITPIVESCLLHVLMSEIFRGGVRVGEMLVPLKNKYLKI